MQAFQPFPDPSARAPKPVISYLREVGDQCQLRGPTELVEQVKLLNGIAELPGFGLVEFRKPCVVLDSKGQPDLNYPVVFPVFEPVIQQPDSTGSSASQPSGSPSTCSHSTGALLTVATPNGELLAVPVLSCIPIAPMASEYHFEQRYLLAPDFKEIHERPGHYHCLRCTLLAEPPGEIAAGSSQLSSQLLSLRTLENFTFTLCFELPTIVGRGGWSERIVVAPWAAGIESICKIWQARGVGELRVPRSELSDRRAVANLPAARELREATGIPDLTTAHHLFAGKLDSRSN